MFEYEIEEHGATHGQYFQGAGTSYTRFTEIATGCGNSAREAGDDALEIFWQSADKEKITMAQAEALEAEINKLSEEDAHVACMEDFDQNWKPMRKWTVTRQRPWDGEPALEYIEISPGDEHFSPGCMTTPRPFTSSDPDEIISTAQEWAEEYATGKCKLPIYFTSAEVGCGEDDTESPESLTAWAEKQKHAIEKEKEAALERAHENCEISHFVSIRWRYDAEE